MPDGQLMPHMSARYRTAMIDAVFEGAGGFERLLAWVEKSNDNYGEFFKIWAKGAIRSPAVDSAEVILENLHASDQAKLINPEGQTAADILRGRLDAITRRAPGIIDLDPA